MYKCLERAASVADVHSIVSHFRWLGQTQKLTTESVNYESVMFL
jgi:hypothetical protein